AAGGSPHCGANRQRAGRERNLPPAHHPGEPRRTRRGGQFTTRVHAGAPGRPARRGALTWPTSPGARLAYRPPLHPRPAPPATSPAPDPARTLRRVAVAVALYVTP